MSKGKPAQRGTLLHDDDFTIVAKYQAEYAGLVQYYLLAQDVFRLGRLHWVMETSLLKTLAGKHRSTVSAMARKYKATVGTPAGPRRCLQGVIVRTLAGPPRLTRNDHRRAGCGELASPVREETDGKGPGQGHLAGGRLHSRRRGLETKQTWPGTPGWHTRPGNRRPRRPRP
jgi:hypothetical protein